MEIIKYYILLSLLKIKTSIIYSSLTTPIVFVIEYFNRSFLKDKSFFIIITGGIIIDAIIGIYWNLKNSSFNQKQLLFGIMEKVIVATSATFIFGAFSFAVDETGAEFVSDYFTLFSRVSVMIYICLSTFRNMSLITDGKFPPKGWFQKLKKFEDTADINELLKK